MQTQILSEWSLSLGLQLSDTISGKKLMRASLFRAHLTLHNFPEFLNKASLITLYSGRTLSIATGPII